MITFEGESVYPDNDGVPTLNSIGVALGRIPRFCGHTQHFYGILGHVLTVARLLPTEYAIYGLMHDAPEACVSDVPSTWKTKEAKELENTLYERICKAYKLDWPVPEKAQEAVEWADTQALYAEAHVLGHSNPELCHSKDGVLPTEPPLRAAVELTEAHLELASSMIGPHGTPSMPAFLRPEIASRVFTQAFNVYYGLWEEATK